MIASGECPLFAINTSSASSSALSSFVLVLLICSLARHRFRVPEDAQRPERSLSALEGGVAGAGMRRAPLPRALHDAVALLRPATIHILPARHPQEQDKNDKIKNLLEFAFGLNPNLRETGTNFGAALMPADGGGADLVLTFRRNTDANDLSFRLQISPDLTDWSTTIAESVNGGDVTALNEAEIVSEEFLEGSSNLVTVRLNFPEGISGRLFSRVQVDWP
jgi:hypothetical protein